MPRYKIIVEYEGSGFVGWQRQDNGLGVQEVLESAAQAFSGEPVTVHGAGRTDAGVHALGQAAHLDLSGDWAADKVRDALNALVRPHPVAVLSCARVDEEFHARFSAVERGYLYRVLNRRAPAALERGHVWWTPRPLDVAAMAEAAPVLLGKHDFSSFRAVQCQAKSPVKTLDVLDVTQAADEIHFRVRARSFLHHQVRNIVGTLALVGEGKWSTPDLKQALEARDRTAGGPTAPADGLYLTDVVY